MIRYFLVLAVTGGSMLAANFVVGLLATSEVREPGAVWHGVHILFSLLTVVALLGVHSIVYTYFVATTKWAAEVVRVYQLPDWYNTAAKKNKRRAFRFILWSMTAIAITAWLGAAADTRSRSFALWHLVVAGFTFAFNLGAFVVEYSVIVSHVRLLLDLKDQADRMRAERYNLQDLPATG
jgi:hypothetical protein